MASLVSRASSTLGASRSLRCARTGSSKQRPVRFQARTKLTRIVRASAAEPSPIASFISAARNPRNYFLSQGIVRACMATLVLAPDLHHILVGIMTGVDKLLGGAGAFTLNLSGDARVFMALAGLGMLMLSISDWAVVLGRKTYAEIKIKLQMELVWVSGIIIAGAAAIKEGLSKSWWAMILLGVIHLFWAIEIYNNRNKVYYNY